jgi:hypothetical protein
MLELSEIFVKNENGAFSAFYSKSTSQEKDFDGPNY